MKLKINHLTTYGFGGGLDYGLQQIRLYPESSPMQTILTWDVDIQGADWQARFQDQHMNHVSLVSLHDKTESLTIRCDGEVETHDMNGILGGQKSSAPLWYYLRQTPLTRLSPGITALAKSAQKSAAAALDQLHDLSGLIRDGVAYTVNATESSTTASQALEIGAGVCQDHAHIFVSAARALGYPARYVSGYLMLNERVDQDASHAWADVWVEDLGWIGFDISNGIAPDERYVRVATGLDYQEAAPVRGLTLGAFDESMQVNIQVQQ